jgi:heptosyltransferase-2
MGGRMNKGDGKILVIQTAFIGDAILTLPMIQVLKRNYPDSSIDVVVVPRAAELFANHPAVSEIISYEKHGADSGLKKFAAIANRLRQRGYDLIVTPHRSMRSALLTRWIKGKQSIGFDRSAGKWFFVHKVKYDASAHEIERNLSLLKPLGLQYAGSELPMLYPSQEDRQSVDRILNESGVRRDEPMVAVAPGTIWNTKRWPVKNFTEVCIRLAGGGDRIVLVGGKEDEALCEEIRKSAGSHNVVNTAGKLSLLQSAEALRRCRILISNDSAPMHLAVAVGTRVIAVFGATVPEFGFAPRGKNDIVVEIKGLKCRPCAIHGGKKCPIKTFDCMLKISPEDVLGKM